MNRPDPRTQDPKATTSSRLGRALLRSAKTAAVFTFVGCSGKGGGGGPEYEHDAGPDTTGEDVAPGDTTGLGQDATGTSAP